MGHSTKNVLSLTCTDTKIHGKFIHLIFNVRFWQCNYKTKLEEFLCHLSFMEVEPFMD